MPRRTVIVEDDDDAVPLNDLLRTGEASRLRRRGAMRATAHRRDDEEDVPILPFHLSHHKGDESYLELECGVRSAEYSFTPAGPSRPSPLPRSSSLRKPSDVGFVFSSTGCGAIVSTRAMPGSIAAHHAYASTEPVSSNIALLLSKYLEPEQRAFADSLTKNIGVCQCDWEAIGCRVCGNAIGFLYAACHSRHGNTHPTYVFFPSAVTPSPNFSFPSARNPESDDMSIDSPTFSPRVTRYFRSDDEFWPSEMNPPLWTSDRELTPTPPRSPPPVATPLAYTAWQAVLPPPASSQTQTQASRIIDAPRHREPIHDVPVHVPVHNNLSFFRSGFLRRPEPPSQNTNDAAYPEELPQPPSDPGTALVHEQRGRAPPERRGVSPTDTMETSSRPLDPPSLHRVPRRSMPPVTRRPTSLDWSSRGRHASASDANSSWAVQGSDEWLSRRVHPARRITMPVPPPPVPTFTLLDALGERSYPSSRRSSFDVRDALGEAQPEDTVAPWLMQDRESGSPVERTWNTDPDGENRAVGGDDSEDKDDDLDERRLERTSRSDNARVEPHSNNSRGLIAR